MASDSNWIRGEPARHILIDQIARRQIRTELNLYALLEDQFQLSDSDLVSINLLPLNSEKICASVLFVSGFEAWNLAREYLKSPRGLGWTITVDPGGHEYEKIKKRIIEDGEMKKIEKRDPTSHDDYRRTQREHSYSSNTTKMACNTFVPCLKIPFECADKLPFYLEKEVLISIFPISRFPSFSDIERGRSSWHCHFGREIDVVEADKMLLTDIFDWKGHKYFFEAWNLVKGEAAWTIPEHYLKKEKEKEAEKEAEKEKEKIRFDNDNNVGIIDDIDRTSLSFVNIALHDSSIMEDGELLSKLPRFTKKRTISESVEERDHEISGKIEGIKVKVKRKPLTRQPFVPPPIVFTPITVVDDKKEDILVNVVVVKPKSKSFTVEALPLPDEIVVIDDTDESPVLASGSARTEGFFELTREEKDRVRFRGCLEAFSSSKTLAASSTIGNVNVNVDSRSSRIQNRRPILLQSTSTMNVTMDLFKVSPLQSAQKLVALRNSSIHSYGLVLMESADPGDLIIEYVGELVRASVANIREWKYEREYCGDGIASSYLFRLDEIMVIDATHQGSLARFINHSCDPNCVAKTITLNGSKRIVMYAKKGIKSGEEITYDYKFPTEKDPQKKVKCLCGSGSCRKYLN